MLRKRVSKCLGANAWKNSQFGVWQEWRVEGTHSKPLVHDSTAIEVGLHEVDDAQLGGGGNVHELLLVLDLGVCAVVGVALSLCAGQFAVQLLQALFTEGSQGALVLFEFGNEGIFIVRVFVLLSTIQHGGHAGVDGRHGGVCFVVSSWKGELFRSNKFTVVSRARGRSAAERSEIQSYGIAKPRVSGWGSLVLLL
jgi:hypothetical protein